MTSYSLRMQRAAKDQTVVRETALLFADARRSGRPIDALPPFAKPQTAAEAYAIQLATAQLMGETIGGWKVGAPSDGELVRGAILNSVMFESPARVPVACAPMLGVEAEIAFRVDRPLPPRAQAYTYAEVAAAVTAFPAIEVVATRFRDYAGTPVLDRAADFMSNGAFVCGPARPDWRRFDLSKIEVMLAIEGNLVVRRHGGHGSGDPLLPAVALVNDMRSEQGVDAGRVMTTGTYTGLNFAKPEQTARVEFIEFGVVEVTFTV